MTNTSNQAAAAPYVSAAMSTFVAALTDGVARVTSVAANGAVVAVPGYGKAALAAMGFLLGTGISTIDPLSGPNGNPSFNATAFAFLVENVGSAGTGMGSDSIK